MAFEWVNLFAAGEWEIYVMYKGADETAASYNQYVRSDLLDPAIITCEVVSGEIVITTVDDAEYPGTNLELPSVVIRSAEGRYAKLRVEVTQSDTDVCPIWLAATLQNVGLTESSPGYLTPTGATLQATHTYADQGDMEDPTEVPNVTSFGYPYVRLTQLGESAVLSIPSAVAISHNVAPFVSVYPWDSNTGFGTKFANPASAIGGTGLSVAFHPSGQAIAIGSSRSASNEGIYAYGWSGAGFGTKYAAPSLPAPVGTNYHIRGLAYSPTGDAIVCTHSDSPYLHGHPWSIGSGFGVRYANPATAVTGSIGWRVKVRPGGNAVGAAVYSSGLGQAYQFNAVTGFGARHVPGVSATSPRGVDFHPSGDTIAFTDTGSSPYVRAYPYNHSTGFGTAYSNPAAAAGSIGTNQQPYDCAFSPDGSTLAVSSGSGWSGTYPITAYPWSQSTGFGTRFAGPASNPLNASNKQSVAFAPDSAAVIATDDASPYVNAWKWTPGSGFGTRFANPGTVPTGLGYGVAFIGST